MLLFLARLSRFKTEVGDDATRMGYPTICRGGNLLVTASASGTNSCHLGGPDEMSWHRNNQHVMLIVIGLFDFLFCIKEVDRDGGTNISSTYTQNASNNVCYYYAHQGCNKAILIVLLENQETRAPSVLSTRRPQSQSRTQRRRSSSAAPPAPRRLRTPSPTSTLSAAHLPRSSPRRTRSTHSMMPPPSSSFPRRTMPPSSSSVPPPRSAHTPSP